MRIIVPIGVTVAFVVFAALSTREDNDLAATALAALTVGLLSAGIAALWVWALAG